MDLFDALAISGGAARWNRLREIGVTERALRAGLASGNVRRVGRGGYGLPTAPAALVAAVALGGVASHVSAASLHGLDVWTPLEVYDVTIPLGSRRGAAGVRVHRSDLGASDVDPRLAVTSLERTLLDCGRSLPLREAVVILDCALHGGRVRLSQLRRAAEIARGHGAAALRRAVQHVDVLAASPLESVLRLLLSLTGGEIRSQVSIPGVGTVDFVVDGWLVIEVDGFEFHSDRRAYRNDRSRANALAERGYALLRFTWEDIRGRPEWVLAQVERVRERESRRPVTKVVPIGTRRTGWSSPGVATLVPSRPACVPSDRRLSAAEQRRKA